MPADTTDIDDIREQARRWLDHDPDPSEKDIREALSGQLCRCTGYENIVRAIRRAAGS